MKLINSLILLLLFSPSCFAQVDFDHYSTLESEGEIPLDFSEQTYEKIEEGMTERRVEIESGLEQREFLQKTGYAIDELLHSGLVVYGDKISKYVSSIGDKLLAGNPSLRSKLRFYTLKLNTTNAFSTDQGIIFVTTGLISQLSSEAQLAFVLAHEISHYTEQHVVETFTWKKNNRYSRDWVRQMSVYSKDKEFSADNLAVDIYREAGYSKEELLSTFDVLLYSYLPFDEIEIDLDYFASDKLFLPNFLFPTKKYEITADPDEDDSESSHPNISKRKRALEEQIEKILEPWGTAINSLGDTEFYEFRNIARFESVRTDVMQADYGNALYSIYLLEREFPNSLYLQRMKMHSWLGLYQYESRSNTSSTIKRSSELEGESAPVHFFIRKLDRRALTTVAIRHIYDIHKRNPNDVEITAGYYFALRLLAEDDKFELEKYSLLTFGQYADSVEANRIRNLDDSTTIIDSLKVSKPSKKSKYDRIRKNNSAPDVNDGSVDTLRYYYFGLSDLLRDSNFMMEFESYIPVEAETPSSEVNNTMTGRRYYQQKAYDDLRIGSDRLIVVKPRIVKYNSRGIDPVKSEKLENMFSDAIVEAGDMAGTMIYSVDDRNLSTVSFNERSLLFGLINQLVQDDEIQPFPVDYSELQGIYEKYGTSDVMFTLAGHTFQPRFNYVALLSIIVWPTIPLVATVYLPIKLMLGNKMSLSLIILDLESCQYKSGASFQFHEPLSKHNIGSRMYSLFKHISSVR